MFRKFVLLSIVAISLALVATSTVFAADEPLGSCPKGFTLEMAMEHDMHHHHHVGIEADLNGDGYICMRHVTSDQHIHVHVDNYLPSDLRRIE